MLSKARLSHLRRYSQKKFREEDGCFLVEGWRTLEAVSGAGIRVELLLVTEAAVGERPDLFARISGQAEETVIVESRQLSQVTDSVTSPGVAALVHWRSPSWLTVWADLRDRPTIRLVALDRVSEPGNLGTIIRTCDWFGVDGVLLAQGTVEAANPKVVRSTMGSLFHLPVIENLDLSRVLAELQAAGVLSWGAMLEGSEPIGAEPWPDRTVLVIGNEARGIGDGLASELDRRIRVPGFGRAESLNAGVATGVLLADWRRARP